MGYSTRTEKTKTGKFAARISSGAYGRGYTVHLTEEFATPAEAYEAATAWQKANAAINAAKKAEKNKAQMTCQCCGRKHLANTGTIAHHGYQRPGGGWQTASCSGAKNLPFEVSRDRLGELIESLKGWEVRAIASRNEVKAEKVSIRLSFQDRSVKRDAYGKRPFKSVEVTRETFESIREENKSDFVANGWYEFDKIKEAELNSRANDIKNVRAEIKAQQARYDGWKPTGVSFDRASKEWK